jgi:RNA polymerase sigma factor (sigma-70 family)
MFTMEGIITVPGKQAVDGRIDRIVRSTKSRLFGFIRSRVNDADDAEDILQDVFYQLAAADPEEQITEVSSWLFTVARNRITDWYRKKKPETFSSFMLDGEDEPPEFTDDRFLPPDVALDESLFREAMTEALGELPEAQRDVFIMHEMEGMPYEEIAEVTGEKVNTLLSRKRYAVKYLRERLAEFAN